MEASPSLGTVGGMKMGWKTVVSALAVLLAAGVFVQLGLGAQSPEPSIAAEAMVGSDDETAEQAPEPAARPDRNNDDRDDRGRDDGNRDNRRDRNDRDRDDRRDKSKDRDDDNGGAPTGGAPAGDAPAGDDADDTEGVQPVNPPPQPVDDDGPGDDDGGDDSDDGGGDD